VFELFLNRQPTSRGKKNNPALANIMAKNQHVLGLAVLVK